MKWLLLTVSVMVVLTVDSRGFASVHNPDNPALGPDSPRIHQKLKKILPDGLNLVKQTGELKTSQVMVHYEPRDQELPEVAHQTERGLLNLSNFQRSDLEENKMQSEMAVRVVSKCDDGGVAIGGECYWFNEELKNWDDAVLACASRGRALASPADPGAILQYAYGKYSQFYSGFWLGGSDVASEGTWVWQSGEPLGDRFPWDPENGHGEPNNANGDENCLEMRIYENRYNDIQCHNTKGYICEGCGGEYTSDNGIIQHPMNGGDYKNNEDCIWTIRATGPIRITFNRFNTEDRYDYLYVRDGDSSGSTLLGTFDGSVVPNTVRTSGNAAYVQFTSDYSVTRTGFEITWEPVGSQCDDGGVAIGGECYWFNEELKNWDDAVLACASRGRALASPANPGAVLEYAYGKYSKFYSGFWLGGSDVASEGTWVWQSGEPLGDRFPWDPENGHGEPNNANGDENCLEMRIHENRYNDIQCHNTKGYICEDQKCVCGKVNRIETIVGGSTTEENEYPWQVALVSQGSTFIFCGGSLINDRWVLTAAHCTQDGVTEVILGNHFRSHIDSTEIRVNIATVVNHPSYNKPSRLENDFALLELATPLNLEAVAPHIRPVCLPNAFNPSQYEDVNAVATGWGQTSPSGPGAETLQEVTVRTMTNSECHKVVGDFIRTSMICATAPGVGHCFGDSGGPLVRVAGGYFNQIGVASWVTHGCAGPNFISGYGRVTDAIDWIKSTSSSGNTCAPPN